MSCSKNERPLNVYTGTLRGLSLDKGYVLSANLVKYGVEMRWYRKMLLVLYDKGFLAMMP